LGPDADTLPRYLQRDALKAGLQHLFIIVGSDAVLNFCSTARLPTMRRPASSTMQPWANLFPREVVLCTAEGLFVSHFTPSALRFISQLHPASHMSSAYASREIRNGQFPPRAMASDSGRAEYTQVLADNSIVSGVDAPFLIEHRPNRNPSHHEAMPLLERPDVLCLQCRGYGLRLCLKQARRSSGSRGWDICLTGPFVRFVCRHAI
jgi:hypothetical protein